MPARPGLGGVTVTIYTDPDGDGVFDTPYTGAIDQNGNTRNRFDYNQT